MISRQKLIEELETEYEGYKNLYCKTFDSEYRGRMDGIDIAIKVVDDQPPADQWIPCSERLPEEKDNELYWTTHEDGSVIQHGYCEGLGFIYNWEVDDLEKRERQGDVIAWMPNTQPEPYKGE